MPLPVVAIVGRPNVGKSTLFNRIIRRRAAVTDPTPGVTRDRHYAEAEWEGVQFTLVDTGGYLPSGEADELTSAVSEQTLIAADQADVILFMIDARSGLVEVDTEIARLIQRKGVPVLLIANKIDDPTLSALAYESVSLGMGDPYPLAAESGYQVGEMLDALVEVLKTLKPAMPGQPDREELALAIIGAPNSGKSSLVNMLAGDERMVVSDIPGTTRDSVDITIRYHGRSIRLIDTAGLRRKRYKQKGLEFYTTLRSLNAMKRSEVAVMLIDAELGITQGDVRLVNQIINGGLGIIIAMNKWDAVEKDPKSADRWKDEWLRRAPGLGWIPILFISALTGQRAIKVIEKSLDVKHARDRRITTSELNERIIPELIRKPPPAVKGKYIKIKYGSQVTAAPPHFVIFASHAELITLPYHRYTERIIRDRYDYTGVPIRVSYRNK